MTLELLIAGVLGGTVLMAYEVKRIERAHIERNEALERRLNMTDTEMKNMMAAHAIFENNLSMVNQTVGEQEGALKSLNLLGKQEE